MPAFLITGNPGSGKTSVALELTRRGFTALDTDEIAAWETAAGASAVQPDRLTDEWLHEHRWVWRRSRLEDAIGSRSPNGIPVFLCGIALNQREMLDCFDLVFLLSLDDGTQLDRLNTASNAHRNAAQRAEIIRGRPVFEQEMRAAGAIVLDGRQPIPAVVDRVLHEVGPSIEPLVVGPPPINATQQSDGEGYPARPPARSSPALSARMVADLPRSAACRQARQTPSR